MNTFPALTRRSFLADAGMGWRDPEVILRLCERLVHLNLGWLEEPLPADVSALRNVRIEEAPAK